MVGAGRRGVPGALTYLALGDSYTIGTGASSPDRAWPALIGARLGSEVVNPAVNGFTTADLIRHELPLLQKVRPRFVSLLIGANDVVQGSSEDRYRAALRQIHDAISAAEPESVLCVSVPDWSVTSAAREFGSPENIRRRIDSFNRVAREEADARGHLWADLTELSRSGSLSPDQLHPDDAQYASWADAIWEVVAGSWSR